MFARAKEVTKWRKNGRKNQNFASIFLSHDFSCSWLFAREMAEKWAKKPKFRPQHT
jgi:hypothetical protein